MSTLNYQFFKNRKISLENTKKVSENKIKLLDYKKIIIRNNYLMFLTKVDKFFILTAFL